MKKNEIKRLLALLDENYGTEAICYLDYKEPWQLLIATILSAQCTDACVNSVTGKLFEAFSTPDSLAGANQSDVERLIHATGFYRNKAKNIIACAQQLVSEYGGEVPSKLEQLVTLAGVGRKTANVIRGNIYHEASIVVDTHVKRISRRLQLTREEDPEKIEKDLMKILPKEHWILFNIQVIAHGRSICTARAPGCDQCFLNGLCSYSTSSSSPVV